MTPQEKAQDLLEKFHKCMYHDMGSGVMGYVNHAKQCAIIAVDELISEHTFKSPISWNIKRKEYWEEVKKEIKKI